MFRFGRSPLGGNREQSVRKKTIFEGKVEKDVISGNQKEPDLAGYRRGFDGRLTSKGDILEYGRSVQKFKEKMGAGTGGSISANQTLKKCKVGVLCFEIMYSGTTLIQMSP